MSSVLLGLSLATAFAQPVSQPELDSFHEEALKRIQALETYIQTIADKKRYDIERNDAIRQVSELFVKEACLNVVSPEGRVVRSMSMMTYLQRLKYLPGQSFRWFYPKVGTWNRQDDSSYVTTIRFGVMQRSSVDLPTGHAVTQTGQTDVLIRFEEDPFFHEKTWQVRFGNCTLQAGYKPKLNP